MKTNKTNWITLFTLLLIFLQPILSFANEPLILAEIVNTQEEVALFKTKSSKALVFKEISVTSVELVVSSASRSNGVYFGSTPALQSQNSPLASKYLIDFKGILTTQIFPFHFFL